MSKTTVRFRVDLGSYGPVGPGKIALLERIDESGSLSQAARDLKMSYKRAWQLLESLNESFSQPVAVTTTGGQGGGGASLTEFGHTLIRSYRSFDDAIQAHADRHFRALVPYVRKSSIPPKGAPVVRLNTRSR
jgi:molybdate transport system regulatory protein